MSNLVIRVTRDLIRQKSGKAAEEYLLQIADEHGDEALTPLLSELNPLEWASILRDHDTGSPSALVDLLKPEQIAEALKAEPLFWNEWLSSYDKELAPFKIIRQSRDLLMSFMTLGNPQRSLEILEEIAGSDAGIFLLSIPFWGINLSGNEFELEEQRDLDGSDVHPDSPTDLDLDSEDELFELIRAASPMIAERILRILFVGLEDENWAILLRSIHESIHEAEETLVNNQLQPFFSAETSKNKMFEPIR